MSKWFHMEPDGFDFHDSAEEAKAKAEESLQYFADEAASDGWSDEVERICWGEVKEVVTEVSRKKAPKGSKFDVIIDYKLRDAT